MQHNWRLPGKTPISGQHDTRAAGCQRTGQLESANWPHRSQLATARAANQVHVIDFGGPINIFGRAAFWAPDCAPAASASIAGTSASLANCPAGVAEFPPTNLDSYFLLCRAAISWPASQSSPIQSLGLAIDRSSWLAARALEPQPNSTQPARSASWASVSVNY